MIAVILEPFIGIICIGGLYHVTIVIIFIDSGVSLTVHRADELHPIIILKGFCTAGIGMLCDKSKSIIPNFLKISINPRADIMACIIVIAVVECAKAFCILMHYTPQSIIGIIYINFSFKVFNSF